MTVTRRTTKPVGYRYVTLYLLIRHLLDCSVSCEVACLPTLKRELTLCQ